VSGRHDEPLPLEAVRDLLGVARAYYRATPAHDVEKRDKIASVGMHLADAIDFCTATAPYSREAAWHQAQLACSELCSLIAVDERAEPLLAAAVGALRQGRGPQIAEAARVPTQRLPVTSRHGAPAYRS